MNRNDAVRDHYEADFADPAQLLSRVAAVLADLPRPLATDALAALDQFHFGGLEATEALARLAGAAPGQRVLDAGCGLGGPARHLAATCGCRVTGIDLSTAYVAVARLLARETALEGVVDYVVGRVERLPFREASFDLLFTQHVVMNVADRPALYREWRRVLAPGGTLAFYDPVAADTAGAPDYPLPWASSPAASTLLSLPQTIETLDAAGLAPQRLADRTDWALRWLAGQPSAPPRIAGLAAVLGTRAPALVRNFVRALRDGRLRLVMGTCRAVSS